MTGSQVFEADCRTVAPAFTGVASLAILDGPYLLGVGKAAWDRAPRGVTLGDVYREHLDDVGRVCGPSASLYLWNTSAGWAELHPLVLARGWVFRSLIVWDKLNTAASMAWMKMDSWPTTHEVAGFYTRGAPSFDPQFARSVWTMAVQGWADERLVTGNRVPGAKNQSGAPSMVDEAMHPRQKPLLFAERMIRASSRPGDTVWVPFGGTLRELVAAERIARADPGEARRVVTCEINADGRDYIGAALEQVEGRAGIDRRQVSLFGGAG